MSFFKSIFHQIVYIVQDTASSLLDKPIKFKEIDMPPPVLAPSQPDTKPTFNQHKEEMEKLKRNGL